MKQLADYSSFAALEILSGTILEASLANTKKPTFRMKIDFGSEIGVKVSCGAYTNYSASELVGKQIIAVVNFAPKKMGPEISEALVLGIAEESGVGTIFLTTDRPTRNGSEIY